MCSIADGLRRDFAGAQGRRVFSLTRSSFAGQQRNGAALWSGDISGSWDSLRRQVSASLNYQLSGIPYWSEDIGGFFRPSNQYDSPDYRELLTRWFQFGVFTPIFRVHGGGSNTEIWNYGAATEADILESAIKLRYRLLPYIYSGFRRVYDEGYTMQRGLVFDFSSDQTALDVADQFMFGDVSLKSSILVLAFDPAYSMQFIGKAFMVAPVVSNSTQPRNVYLPASEGGWTNFYTGEVITGSTAVTVPVPSTIRQIPLLVRAGSIVALGPDGLQWTGEKQSDPLELRIYSGADGYFQLFEDDGVTADFSTGTRIAFSWDDKSKTLTVSERTGESFSGMLHTRTLHVVAVAKGHGVGVTETAQPDKIISYDGHRIEVAL